MKIFAFLVATVSLWPMALVVRAAEPVPSGQKLTILAGKTTILVNIPPEAEKAKPQITLRVSQPKGQSGKPARIVHADGHVEAEGNVTFEFAGKKQNVKLQADRITITQKSQTLNIFELEGHAHLIVQEGEKTTRELSSDSIKIEWLSADQAIVLPKPTDHAVLKDILTSATPK